ncbi:MAG TPA: hypothetical protein VFJ61_09910 [Solirubrobacterales bacterium]|nr:hypothetical protein [Solirubrobacterales bacterium]
MCLLTSLLAVVGPAPAFAAPAPGVPVSVAPGVPDQGRAWELITPADPMPGVVAGVRGMSVEGDRISYALLGLLPGAVGSAPLPSFNIAERGSAGWTSAQVPTPYGTVDGFPGVNDQKYGGPQAFNPDLSTWLGIRHRPLAPGQAEYDVALLRWGPGQAATELANLGPNATYVGASTDLSRVFFTAEKHLLPADAGRVSGQSIYELFGSTVRLVDVDNDGELLSDCGSTVPRELAENPGMDVRKHVVSNDGRRVFFWTQPSCTGPTRVYLREGAATTTEISASRCTLADCGPAADVYFAEATPDGSVAFLYTAQRLTDEDTDALPDFYRYDVAGGDLKLFRARVAGAEPRSDFPVPTDIATSADGSRLYFYATDAGASAAPNHLLVAEAGGTREVAPAPIENSSRGFSSGAVQLAENGRYAVFTSQAPNVPSDTDGSIDIYRYDAEDGSLIDISAGPAGGGGSFDANLRVTLGDSVPSRPFRSVSADGSRILFGTSERLVPEDHNSVRDVYEWVNGALGLVSSGAGDRDSDLMGMTTDGRTAVIRTSQTLLGLDRDGGDVDLYAARIGGGFPEPSLEAPAECEGGNCVSVGREALDRSPADTAGAGPDRIVMRRIDAAARRQIAASGRIALLVELPRQGRLAATARARLAGRERTIGSATAQVAEAGPMRLTVPLSKAARRKLGQGGRMRVRLRLRLSGLEPTATTSFALKGKR